MPDSPATQQALQWLKSGQAPAQRAQEVARSLALLQVSLAPAAFKQGVGPDVELALLLLAESSGRLDLVAALSQHAAHKATAKHAKKLLFRAKQRGLEVPDAKSGARPVSFAVVPDPLPSFASSYDSAGNQVVILGGWTAAEGQSSVLAIVSDRSGLLSGLSICPTSRTQQREMIDRLSTQVPGFTVPVPQAFAAGRIRWGLDLLDSKGGSFEGDQADVRRAVALAEPVLAQDVAVDLDPEDEARLQDHVAAASQLAADAAFSTWLNARSSLVTALAAHADAVKAAEPDARQALADERWSLGVDGWLAQEERLQLAERLDVSAWMLATMGRRQQAVQATATARALRDATLPLSAIAFVRALASQRHSASDWLLSLA